MTSNEFRLQEALTAWNAGDLAGYLTLYSPDVRLHGYAPAPMGSGEVRAFYEMVCATLHADGMRNPVIHTEEMFSAGDRVCFRGAMSGNLSGPFMGATPNGRTYWIGVLTWMDFADGRVTERWSCADMLGVLAQTGAVRIPLN